jgi:glycosyltransferase involved in cell wall biosynthesis
MKIAHVTATFPPYWAGTGNVAYHDARLMHELGHDVTVFTAATPRDHEMTFPFPVERLPAVFRIGNAPLTPALPRRLRGFDLIHLHYPFIFGAELTMLAAWRSRTPTVVTYHNDLLAPGLRGLLFDVYTAVNQRWVLRAATRLLTTSEDYARHSAFARTAPRGSAGDVVPNGVDVEVFHPDPAAPQRLRARLEVPDATPVVLFVGGLDRAHHFKGLHVLLEAMRHLPEACLVVIGDGDMRAGHARAAATAGTDVRFAGKVPLDQLVESYQGADVTVLPSVTQGEAFGMVLIESLACGTPVVATNLPGVRTVVRDGVDGALVAPGDVAALVGALRRVISARDREALTIEARRRVVGEYSWSAVARRLEAVYESVAASRP